MNKKKSFTLIELLVVIVIIGVLAGLIVVGVTNSISQAQDAKIKATMLELSKALKMNSLDSFPIETTACDLQTDCTTLKSALNIPSTQDHIYYKTSSSGNFFVIYATKPSETNLSFEINSNIEEVKEVPSFSNLVAYYPLSMGASNGTTISDMSSNSNHGTNYGATFAQGVDGNGNSTISFDGDDYVVFSNYGLTTNVAISFFVYSSSSSALWTNPISFGNSRFRFEKANTNIYTIYDTGFSPQINISNIVNDTWNSVIFTSDGVNWYVYLNGSLNNNGSVSGSFNEANLNLGRRYDGCCYWKGKLQDLRVYDRALSADEVELLYNNKN